MAHKTKTIYYLIFYKVNLLSPALVEQLYHLQWADVLGEQFKAEMTDWPRVWGGEKAPGGDTDTAGYFYLMHTDLVHILGLIYPGAPLLSCENEQHVTANLRLSFGLKKF